MELQPLQTVYHEESIQGREFDAALSESLRWWFGAEGGKERIRMPDRPEVKRFFKRYGIALAGILLLMLYTLAVRAVTAHTVRKEVTEQLTAEYETRIEETLQAYKDEQQAAYFLSGEASRKAAMAEDAAWIAKVLYGVRDNSTEDLRTAVWCILARVDNPYYPDSVREVCEQKGQWMGFGSDNPVLTNLKQIALEELETYYAGERIVGQEYVYLYWTPTEITLRDAWKDGSGTHYWRWNG